MLFFCLLFTAYSKRVVEYRFSTNYGSIIYDHSGNDVTGVLRNGGLLTSGVVFTDRGFYVSSKYAIAPLKVNMTQMPNPGTFLLWVLTDSTEGRLLHSISNQSLINHFKIFKGSLDRLIIEYYNDSLKNLTLQSSTFFSNEWVLISITLADSWYIFKQNGLTLASIDMGSKINYSYWTVLGWDYNIYPVVKGFIWYFTIVDYENAEVAFIGKSYQTCFLKTCSNCKTYIYDDKFNQSGCIANVFDVSADAQGNSCSSTKPCRDSKVIECLCESKSCSYESIDKFWCVQITTHQFLRSSAACEIDGQGCCLDICSECSNMTACISCVEANAFVDDDGLCTCKPGYYGSRPLNFTGACNKCADECLECENLSICTVCVDENANPTLSGCVCKDGFWSTNNGSLVDNCEACKNECKSCSNDYSCIECQLGNSTFINGKCECVDGFKLRIINNELVCSDKCFEGCSVCESGECKSCLDSNAEIIDDINCDCKNGYFKNDSETNLENLCVKCSYGCNSCTSNSNCNSCQDQFKLNDNFCICKPGYYSKPSVNDDSFECIKCPLSCDECLDNKKCISCKENFILEGDNCVCMPGFTKYQLTCIQNHFEGLLSVNKSNIIKLSFNESLVKPLNFSDIILNFEDSTVIAFQIYKSSVNFCILILELPDKLPQNLTFIAQISTNPVYSAKKSLLREYTYIGLLNDYKAGSNITETKIFRDSAQAALLTSAVIGFILKPAFLWNLLNTLDIIKYLPLTTNNLTSEIRKLCAGVSLIIPVPNLAEEYMNKNSSSVPIKEVQDCQIEYSPFIFNSARELLIFIIFVLLYPFMHIAQHIVKSSSKFIIKKIKKFKKNYRYNFFFRFFLQVYLNFGVYAIVQLKSEKLSSPIEFYLNQVCAIAFLVLFCIVPGVIMVILCVNEKEVEQSDKLIVERFGTLFCTLKTEKGLKYSVFWVLFAVKRIQFLLTQFFMNFNYFAQIGLNLVFSLSLIVYLVFYKPMKSRNDLINNIVSELCIAISFTLVLFLNIFKSSHSQEIINGIFFYTIIGYIVFQVILGLILLMVGFRNFCLSYEKKRALDFIKNNSLSK